MGKGQTNIFEQAKKVTENNLNRKSARDEKNETFGSRKTLKQLEQKKIDGVLLPSEGQSEKIKKAHGPALQLPNDVGLSNKSERVRPMIAAAGVAVDENTFVRLTENRNTSWMRRDLSETAITLNFRL